MAFSVIDPSNYTIGVRVKKSDLNSDFTAAQEELDYIARVTGELIFPTKNVNQTIDVSDRATHGTYRYGADWNGSYTTIIDASSGVPYGTVIEFSNNSGHDQFLASGEGDPLDLPFDPFRVPDGEFVRLQRITATGKLAKSMRAWETSSSRVTPFGGTEGDFLGKVSDNDSDFDWLGIDDLDTMATFNSGADYVMVWDATDGKNKRILGSNLPFGGGGGGGGGDMTAAVYDPGGVSGDAFDMDNMVEGGTNLILTSAERSLISGAMQRTNSAGVVYVAKHGSDSDDGLTSDLPKLTIGSAITAAAALITAGSDSAGIVVLDGDTYTEDFTLSTGLRLHAPYAKLVSQVILSDDTWMDVGDHMAPNGMSGAMVALSGSTAKAFYKCRGVMDTRGPAGTNTSVVGCANGTDGGILHMEGAILYVAASSAGITDTASAFGHVHFRFGDIYLAGNGAAAISTLFLGTKVIGYVDHILEVGSPTGTIGVNITTDDTSVILTASEIIADEVWNITDGDLYICCPKLTGTQTGTPIERVLTTTDLTTLQITESQITDIGTHTHDPADLPAPASATNYTPTSSSIEGHLEGIDTAIGAIDPALNVTGSPSAGEFLQFTAADTVQGLDEAAFKAAVNLEIGTDVQAYDVLLADIATLTDPGADRLLLWDDSVGAIVWVDPATLAGSVSAEDDGSEIVATATTFNFTGSGVTVTDAGGGVATVNVAGGSAPVDSVFGRTGVVVAAEGDYDIGELGDVAITSVGSGEILGHNGSTWLNRTLAEAGIAADDHTHDWIDPAITSVAGTTYQIDADDYVIVCTNGSTLTITVPANATTAIPVGRVIDIIRDGAEDIDIAAAGGVTIKDDQGLTVDRGQARGQLRKIATDTWIFNSTSLNYITTTVAGTTDTIGQGQANTHRVYTSGSPVTVTINTTFPSNASTTLRKAGAGTVTLTGSGVTLNGAASIEISGSVVVKREASSTDLLVEGETAEPVTFAGDVTFSGTTSGISLDDLDDVPANIVSGSGSGNDIVRFTGTGTEVEGNNRLTFNEGSGIFEVQAENSGSAADPTVRLYKVSATPAVNDELGEIDFRSGTQDLTEVQYSRIYGYIADRTDLAQSGGVKIAAWVGGTEKEQVRIGPDELYLFNLPTSDPTQAGQVWNNGGVLSISSG